jgi:predicted GNAT family N-acyltransferase
MPYTVRFASSPEDREKAYELRRQVFEVEQNVPRPLDRDANDHNANHVVAIDADGRCVGTGRLVRVDARSAQIGRMAVAASHRRQGVGDRVIDALERMAALRGICEVALAAQLPAVPFFLHHGYVQDGKEFLDSGVPHVLMRKVLPAVDLPAATSLS